jgi:hypothetical protein
MNNKLLTGALAALALVGGTAAFGASAQAADFGRHGGYAQSWGNDRYDSHDRYDRGDRHGRSDWRDRGSFGYDRGGFDRHDWRRWRHHRHEMREHFRGDRFDRRW